MPRIIHVACDSYPKGSAVYRLDYRSNAQNGMRITQHERIWEKGPIGIFFTNSIPEKLPF